MIRIKKAMRLLPFFCILLLAVILSPRASALSGSGTEEDPYVITRAADIAAMHDDLDGYYVLGADINMSGVSHTPIGNAIDGAFTGSFDGKGHTISNLVMNLGETKFVGLFGYLEGTVKDVKLKSVSIIGGRYVGGIAGNAGYGSSVTGCSVLSGSISSPGAQISTNVGGITGLCEGHLSGCSNAAAISANYRYTNATGFAGGIIGYSASDGLQISGCTNSATVYATTAYGPQSVSGGIIGYAEYPVIVNACSNTGAVSTGSDGGDYYGGGASAGIIGCTKAIATLTDCTNSGKIDAKRSGGGIIGLAIGKTILTRCDNRGEVFTITSNGAGYCYSGGIIGRARDYSLLTECDNYGRIYGYYTSGILYAEVSGSVLTSCTNNGALDIYNNSSYRYVLCNKATISEDSVSVIVGLSLSSKSALCVGDVYKPILGSTPTASVGYNDSITWKSSDESVLSVAADGTLTAHKFGSARITVTTAALGLSAHADVSVVPTLELNYTKLSLPVGHSVQLTPIRTPECEDTYTWTSSSSSLVSVSSTGLVTVLSINGHYPTTTITVKSSSGLSATCVVTPITAPVQAQSVALNHTLLRPMPGETIQLSAEILPANTTDKTLRWESSDPEVASVSSTGLLEAIRPGNATITVTTANGLYDLCEVKVVALSSAAFVAESNRAAINNSFNTAVRLVKNPGIAAFTMELDYNANLMTPTAVTAGELLSGGTLTSNVDTAVEDGKLRITWYSAEDATGDGVAFTVTWKAGNLLSSCAVTPVLTAGDVCNAEQAEVRVNVEAGTVRILDRAVGDIYYDELVNMKDIVYFARYFNEQETLSDEQRLAADLLFDDVIDVKDLTGLAQLLSENFPTPDESESDEQSAFGVSLFADAPQTFEITVSDTTAEKGKDAVVQVSGANCTGLAALRLGLRAPEGFEVVSVQPSALLTDNGSFAYNSETGVITWYDSVDRALNGELFSITLRTDSTFRTAADVELDYSEADFFSADGYEEVPVTMSAGTISPAPYFTIESLTSNGALLTVGLRSNTQQSALLAVGYYQNGQLTYIETREVTGSQTSCNLSIPDGSAPLSCRVFLMDLTSYKPLSETKTLSIR